jgi:hypothetical protein
LPPIESLYNLSGGLEAVLRITCHRLADDGRERWIEIGYHLLGRNWLGQDDLEHELVERGRIEGHMPGDGLV